MRAAGAPHWRVAFFVFAVGLGAVTVAACTSDGISTRPTAQASTTPTTGGPFGVPADKPTPSALCPAERDAGPVGLASVDGGSRSSFAIGAPDDTLTEHDGQGSVQLHTGAGVQQLLDGSFGGEGQTSQEDHWGSAMVIADLDHDGCAELVVGAPAPTGQGHVTVLHGSVTGAAATPFRLLTPPKQAYGDRYGAALAVTAATSDSPAILWVGAPGTEVNGIPGAGVLYEYVVSPAGAPRLRRTLSEASPSIGLTPAAGDHFGQVLSASHDGGVAIGVPDRDVNGQRDAGVIVRIPGPYDAAERQAAQVVSQGTAGVPDTAEAGDRFGAALDAGGRIVGVPGEDVGTTKDVGLVQIFTLDKTSSLLVPGRTWVEQTTGVVARAVAGDRFGASVASGYGVACYGYPTFVVGAPGMDQGRAKDAGGVVVLPSGGRHGCRGALLQQGRGLPGASESGDHLGTVLATVVDGARSIDDEADSVLIGVPGEDIDIWADAGRVIVLNGSGSEGWAPYSQGAREIDAVQGPDENRRFGLALSQPPGA